MTDDATTDIEQSQPGVPAFQVHRLAEGVKTEELPELLEDAEYINLINDGDQLIFTPAAILGMDSVNGPGKAVLGADREGWPVLVWYTAGMRRLKRYLGQEVILELSGRKPLEGGRSIKLYEITPVSRGF